MSTAAHSKDNGSPTSVAHKLDDDQTDSVVVRRDDLVVIDNTALAPTPASSTSSSTSPRPARSRSSRATPTRRPSSGASSGG